MSKEDIETAINFLQKVWSKVKEFLPSYGNIILKLYALIYLFY